ncbi:DegT/DnrJ/EryC1/StrS family aminotransferase [Phenylobacterium sp.]|uniref:DegT/DnrJ/EryC1/StrS family aminotransferase n=1 Tax=Phenylobacterium sp. TaxID=1871053 RepID=UPI002F929268
MQNETAAPRIPVAAPLLDGREREYVLECLDSTWISSAGRFIGEFETRFADFCGVKHAIATNNGTTALHLALVALGVGPGDEVIIPTLTYIATANAVTYCGATPVLADCDPRTLNLDVEAVAARITSRTKVIIPVHLYGHPVDMAPLRALADMHGLLILEDAAEAAGAQYRGQMAGALGTCATFSFFGNKIITTGEGGMVTTNDDELAARLRLYRGQGMDPNRRYWFEVVGYNYRMTNVAAAIGLGQLERIHHHLERRREVAAAYNAGLAPLGNRLVLPVEEPWAKHVYWMYTVLLGEEVEVSRDEVMARLDRAGVETRPVFYPMHILPPYQPLAGDGFPNAERCAARGINLPTHALLSDGDIQRVCAALAEAVSG